MTSLYFKNDYFQVLYIVQSFFSFNFAMSLGGGVVGGLERRLVQYCVIQAGQKFTDMF